MTEDIDQIRADVGKKYGLPDDVTAALSGKTRESLEIEAGRWAEFLAKPGSGKLDTDSILRKAIEAGSHRVVRLLGPERPGEAEQIDREAIEAAENAAEIAVLANQQARQADRIRRLNSDGRVLPPNEVVDGGAKAVERGEQRSRPDDDELPRGWRRLGDG